MPYRCDFEEVSFFNIIHSFHKVYRLNVKLIKFTKIQNIYIYIYKQENIKHTVLNNNTTTNKQDKMFLKFLEHFSTYPNFTIQRTITELKFGT